MVVGKPTQGPGQGHVEVGKVLVAEVHELRLHRALHRLVKLGLDEEELALCDAATSVPLAVEQPSLNLAQAVMLYAWELSTLNRAATPSTQISTALPHVREALNSTLNRLGVAPRENLHRWANEALARFDDRDLGMLLTLLKRL